MSSSRLSVSAGLARCSRIDSTAHKDGSPSSRQFLRDLARKYAYRCRARAEHEEITLGRLWTRRETDQLAS